ncbi:carbamate kinase [Lentilactobacillus rapi]|uniref:Carbamate kinase n=1 Tax=Lentilactobacillus rapi TaxID=481723 RepID=A0A512PKX8_9LACO|nr:carbamate kinase [Lentilactobacillus rapi]GEP71866.1 carbamate kinase [Lentilactobacillus rapi]
MGRKIVVALGGNAILSKDASAAAQQQALRETAEQLVKFVENGDQLIISHGNGPQVGNLLLQQAGGSTKDNPEMPLDTCVAMTQGSIGYWMQNAMNQVIKEKGLNKTVATIVTQVEVSADDPAFKNPTKPIGHFMNKDEADLAKKQNPDFTFVEDSGRGYRRVVPSPKPTGVVETAAVNTLVDAGIVPISVGGGGIPVVTDGNQLIGKEAVIDKDFASEKLAELVGADALIILTAVNNIFVNFNKPNQKKLEEVTVPELEKFIDEKQFAPGSMLPKVQAAMDFVNATGNEAVVTALDNIEGFIDNGSGTIIKPAASNVR